MSKELVLPWINQLKEMLLKSCHYLKYLKVVGSLEYVVSKFLNFLLFIIGTLASNGGRLCFPSVYLYLFFIHHSFSDTTRPIFAKFSGIVYFGVV